MGLSEGAALPTPYTQGVGVGMGVELGRGRQAQTHSIPASHVIPKPVDSTCLLGLYLKADKHPLKHKCLHICGFMDKSIYLNMKFGNIKA